MVHSFENRREFLKHASMAAILPFLFSCKGDSIAQISEGSVLSAIRRNAITAPNSNWTGAKDVPDNVGWKTKLADSSDKGEPMLISGTVYQTDGRTPAPNILIYLYHTDAEGIYGRSGQHRHGRHRGWMLTDANGRYEFQSIRPASYPNTTFAAHIHMTLTGTAFKEDWIDSILFEGDRFISAPERVVRRGGFNPILKLERGGDGILKGVRDIQLMA